MAALFSLCAARLFCEVTDCFLFVAKIKNEALETKLTMSVLISQYRYISALIQLLPLGNRSLIG